MANAPDKVLEGRSPSDKVRAVVLRRPTARRAAPSRGAAVGPSPRLGPTAYGSPRQRHGHGGPHGMCASASQTVKVSATESASSSTASPSSTSSGVVVQGGTTWVLLKWVKGHSPRSLHAAAKAVMGAAGSPPAL